MNVSHLTKYELVHDLISQKEKVEKLQKLFQTLVDLVPDPNFRTHPDVQHILRIVRDTTATYPSQKM